MPSDDGFFSMVTSVGTLLFAFVRREIAGLNGMALQFLSQFLFSHCIALVRLHPPAVPNLSVASGHGL